MALFFWEVLCQRGCAFHLVHHDPGGDPAWRGLRCCYDATLLLPLGSDELQARWDGRCRAAVPENPPSTKSPGVVFVWRFACRRCRSSFHLEAAEPNGPRGWSWACRCCGGELDTLLATTRRA